MVLPKRVPLGWLNLTHRKGRFAVALAGVSFAIVLMFVQLGFRNALYDSTVQLIRHFKADLVLRHNAKYALGVTERIPLYCLDLARGVPGVARARPLYIEFETSRWRGVKAPDGDPPIPWNIRSIAVNLSDPALDIPEIAAYADRLRAPDTVLMDERSKNTYGDWRRQHRGYLAGKEVHVVGTFKLGTDFANDGNLILSEENFAKFFPLRGLQSGSAFTRVDLGLLRLAPDADLEAVRAALEKVLPDNVFVKTRDEFEAEEMTFWQKSTPIGFVFRLGMTMGFLVGVVICFQILSTDVADHLKEYATLKAIGYANRYLTLTVIQQAVLLALVGFVPGLLFSLALYRVLAGITGLPLSLTFGRAALILVLTVLMCVLSGLLALRKVKQADPAEVF
jgi:putative ABC transport system permease protein